MDRLFETLEALVKILDDMDWMIVGSAALYILGVDVKPEDIDILTDDENAHKIDELLSFYRVAPLAMKKNDIFESYFGTYDLDGMQVEVMGDLKIRGKSYGLGDKIFVEYKGIKIPVRPLALQYEAYNLMNRDKDREKLRKIKEKLESG